MEPESDPLLYPNGGDESHAKLGPEQQRLTYQLCRLGFGLLSGALVLACFTSLLALSVPFGGLPILLWFKNMPWWRWHDVPIVWGTLIGTYLLWGRWKERGWQRRAGLLLLMCGVDLALWFLDHMHHLGLYEGEVGHQWLREQFGAALGWAEFTLLASLACEMMAHLGVEHAPEAGKATRSLAATGAAVWMIQFVLRTDWARGWPLLEVDPFRRPELLLLLMGSHMIWTITLIQVTALTVTTTRQTTRVLAEMTRDERRDDLFQDRREADGFHPWEQDNPWKAPRNR